MPYDIQHSIAHYCIKLLQQTTATRGYTRRDVHAHMWKKKFTKNKYLSEKEYTIVLAFRRFACHLHVCIHTWCTGVKRTIYAYVCVHMRECVCSCVCTYIYIYIYNYMQSYMYTHVYINVYVQSHINTCIHIYVCTYTHTHTYQQGNWSKVVSEVSILTRIHVYIYTHIYIHIHTNTYAHFHTLHICTHTNREARAKSFYIKKRYMCVRMCVCVYVHIYIYMYVYISTCIYVYPFMYTHM